MSDDGVANLVESHHFFLIGLQHAAAFFKASHYPLNRLV